MHQPWVLVVQAQNGSTALHNAAANGHAKAVEALVDAPSCDCDVQNSNGNTALHLAASKGTLLPPVPSPSPPCSRSTISLKSGILRPVPVQASQQPTAACKCSSATCQNCKLAWYCQTQLVICVCSRHVFWAGTRLCITCYDATSHLTGHDRK